MVRGGIVASLGLRSGSSVHSHCRRAEESIGPLLEVVCGLLNRRDAKQDALDTFQNGTVEFACWRDCRKPAEKNYGTVEKTLEAGLVDQLA